MEEEVFLALDFEEEDFFVEDFDAEDFLLEDSFLLVEADLEVLADDFFLPPEKFRLL